MKKKSKKLKLILLLVLAALLVAEVLLVVVLESKDQGESGATETPGNTETVSQEQEETVGTEPSETVASMLMPWDEPGAKQPEDYSWEEYELLTPEQQQAFQEYVGVAGFVAWSESAQSPTESNPWDEEGAKQPEDYTWEEFEALTAAQQMAFQTYLGEDAFEAWLNQAQAEKNPWDEPGAKKPEDYTLEEFEALTVDQQMAFQNYLGEDGFETWMDKVQQDRVETPWEEPGAKQPEDYTWEEFEALSSDQQIAFQNYMGADAFDAWLNKVQSQTVKNPWEEPGAKQPEDYNWEEFEALTAEQQMAFQEYLGEEGFEKWMEKAQSQTAVNPWEKPGAKQPEDYNWEEFEALTADQQMAFQNFLGPEAFEAWLIRVTS